MVIRFVQNLYCCAKYRTIKLIDLKPYNKIICHYYSLEIVNKEFSRHIIADTKKLTIQYVTPTFKLIVQMYSINRFLKKYTNNQQNTENL